MAWQLHTKIPIIKISDLKRQSFVTHKKAEDDVAASNNYKARVKDPFSAELLHVLAHDRARNEDDQLVEAENEAIVGRRGALLLGLFREKWSLK